MIRLAYERAVENTGKLSFAYINKVLQNWHREGVRTAADAANASAAVRRCREAKPLTTSRRLKTGCLQIL